ncbi:MAG: hypothetical protein LC802_04780 [Acidobacteria bacterium]|nr:hypothetical protein [Acidobacteriota bacterium]
MSDFPLLQTTREDLNFLKHRWLDLVGQYGGTDAAKERWFVTLSERYSERSRFYHNLHHIAEMLRLLDSLVGAQDIEAVSVAAWFHDAVYDTWKSDNEERSADLASQALGELWARAETVAEVRQLILATKKHEGEGFRPSARLFLDADLSILGAGEEVYLQYSEAIRRVKLRQHIYIKPRRAMRIVQCLDSVGILDSSPSLYRAWICCLP